MLGKEKVKTGDPDVWIHLLNTALNNVQQRGSSSDARQDLSLVTGRVSAVLSSPFFRSHLESVSSSKASLTFLLWTLAGSVVNSFPQKQVEELNSLMTSQITSALLTFFSKPSADLTVRVLPTLEQSRLYALRSALHHRYPVLAAEGCTAISRPPVFYLTEGSPAFHSVDRISWELLVARKNFRVIPLRKNPSVARGRDPPEGISDSEDVSLETTSIPTYSIDLEALETEIIQDKAAGLLPCCVLATLGAELHQHSPYQCDDVEEIRKLCDKHGLWLHAEGSSLILAAGARGGVIPALPPVLECVNSLCGQPLEWLGPAAMGGAWSGCGVGEAVSVTLLREPGARRVVHDSGALGVEEQDQGLTTPVQAFTAEAFCQLFVLWYHLVSVPEDHLRNRVEKQVGLVRQLEYRLVEHDKQYPSLLGPSLTPTSNVHPHILFFQFRGPVGLALSELNLDTRSLNKLLHDRIAALIDRYTSATSSSTASSSSSSSSSSESGDSSPGIFRALFEHYVSLTDYQGHMGFLFHPLSSTASLTSASLIEDSQNEVGIEAVNAFVDVLFRELDLLTACLKHRASFLSLIEREPELQVVSPGLVGDTFVGLGALRFTPAFRVSSSQGDALNALLVRRLALKDPLYTGATTTNTPQQVVVVIQTSELVLNPNCPQIVLAAILEAASKLEMPTEVVDGLSKVIEKGIAEAQKKLEGANAEVFQPTNLIRYIPLVGSVVNWWAPKPNVPQAKPGHKFDIRSQTLETLPRLVAQKEQKEEGNDEEDEGEEQEQD